MKESKTERGFDLIEFIDLYGSTCSIQKSSLASDDAIWIGPSSAEPKVLASHAADHGVATKETTGWVEFPIPADVLLTTRMHLNREQVQRLLPILHRFVDTGDIVDG